MRRFGNNGTVKCDSNIFRLNVIHIPGQGLILTKVRYSSDIDLRIYIEISIK